MDLQQQNKKQQDQDREKLNSSTNNFYRTQPVVRERNCNGFTARNLGDTIVSVNGIVLFPSLTPLVSAGDSVTFGFNEDQIYVGNITIAFAAPLGAIPNLEIVQLYFVNEKC